MSTRKIETGDLKHYFDNLSNVLPATLVEIEVVGLDVGDQLETSGLKLTGISYDPKDNNLLVNLDDKLEHCIRAPQQVYVDEDSAGLHSLEVVCGEGHRHIIKFKA
jgi:hypothetical protein